MRGAGERCRWAAAGAAAAAAAAAVVVAICWVQVFESVLSRQLALTPGSRSYREWAETTVPLHFDIFLFNWTNADRFPEEKPNFQELGPYRFRERRRHVNISWHAGNDTLGYRTLRTYHFDAEASNGTLSDNVTTLNAIAATAVYKKRFESFMAQKGVAFGLAVFGHKLWVSKPAGELLFEGYQDKLLDLANSMPASVTGDAPRVDKFGWFYTRNNSLDGDGYMEVSAGGGGVPGHVRRWNMLDRLPYYDGECAEIRGSVGEFLPRNLTDSSRLTMFIPDLCRTVRLERVGDGRLAGLDYRKYAVGASSFDDQSPCFCPGGCRFAGVMNVSACRYGSPVLVSLPHFLHAPALQRAVGGLAPDPARHQFYFAVEPKLGIPLDVAARFQLNVLVEANPNVAIFEELPTTLFPILWVQQRVRIQEELLSELRVVRGVRDWGGLCCAGVGLALAALVAVAMWTNVCANLCANVCGGKVYAPPAEIVYEKPRDESEVKLNQL